MSDVPTLLNDDGFIDAVIGELLRQGVGYIDVGFRYESEVEDCRTAIRQVLAASIAVGGPPPLTPRHPTA